MQRKLYLDCEVVLNLIKRPRRREPVDRIHGKLLLAPWYYAVAVPEILCGKHQAKIRKVACLGHLDADCLRSLCQRFHFSRWFVALVVEYNLLVYADCDLLDCDLLCFGQPIWVRG